MNQYIKKNPSLAERFWAKVNKELGQGPEGKCWLWAGSVTKKGYGRLRNEGKILPAHRLSYELNTGPIPEGLLVCHTCDTPACVNPAHLFPGTNQENMDDMNAKGRGYMKPQTHCLKGHEFTPETTIVNPKTGDRKCRLCAQKLQREWHRANTLKKKATS